MRSLLSFAALVAALAMPLSSLGQERTAVATLIVGGKPVQSLSDTPWQVALIDHEPSERREQFCGGSLVAPQWVLTAAHCVDNSRVQEDPKRLDIVAGTLAFADGGERIAVERMIVHPKWRTTGTRYDYDAALLKLATPSTKGVPISLARGTSLPTEPVRVTGWGSISENGPGSPVLLFVEVPTVTNTECNKPESYGGRVSDQMFCAGVREGGLDSCQGDSGGPVDGRTPGGKRELVGIVSWGWGCAREFKYGVYARVSSVSTWVQQETGATGP